MFKNRLLAALLAPFFMFNTEFGGGGAVDRGDNFTPTVDDDDEAAKAAAEAAAAEEAAKKAAEEAAKKDEKKDDDKKDDDKKDDDDKGKKKDTRIPLSRHEQILAKERERREALEAELAKRNKQEQQVQADKVLKEADAKLESLEEKYNKALVDGDVKEAQKLMKEIRTTEREIAEHKAETKAAAATEQAIEAIRYDNIVERLEAAYPQIVPGSESYDKAAVAEILELKEAFELKGHRPSAALQRAVKYVLGAESKKQETAVEVTPRVSEDDVAAKLKEERKAEASKKAVDASKKQPPASDKLGVDSDKLGGTPMDAKAIMKMSQSDFAKLDDETLARLRGDTV